MCKHGCFAIQINDQGTEFVNKVSAEMHRLTGTKQRVTSAYHPQANGLIERFNRTLKGKFRKLLATRAECWPEILEAVLFAYRCDKHQSTGYSPFFMLYGREPALPADASNLHISPGPKDSADDKTGTVDDDCDHTGSNEDTDGCERILRQMLSVKEQVFTSAATNISKAQERQKLDYDRRHIFKTEYKPGDKVLCKNLRRDDRKGGWKEAAWKGPYVIKEVHTNNSVTLLGKNQQALRKKIPVANLKRYNSAVSSIGDSSDENPSDPIKQKSLHSDEYKTGTVDDQQSNKSYVSMEVVGEGPEPPPLIFAPINYAWQKKVAGKMGLEIFKKHTMPAKQRWMEMKDAIPGKVVDVLGDGNCFYRAISYAITGAEDSHVKLRKKLATYMSTDSAEKLTHWTSNPKYVKENRVGYSGPRTVWATTTEILAMASLLQTDIVTYKQTTYPAQGASERPCFQWLPLKSCQLGEETLAEASIYLKNQDDVHFIVVTSLDKKKV